MNAQPVRIENNTKVTYPTGATSGTGRVLAAGAWGLIVAETPFHPGDGDQPADAGSVEFRGERLSVVDCRVGAVEVGSGRLVFGDDLPASGCPGDWRWVVVHVLDGGAPVTAGSAVSLRVDPRRRLDLSVAHTAQHLVGFALNAALASLWRQGVPPDSLGHPDFSTLARRGSTVTPTGFRDSYRIRTGPAGRDGASGLAAEELDALVRLLGYAVNDRVRRWLARRAPVRVVTAGPYLTDLRWWECDLPQGTARVACGATHAVDLRAIARLDVDATLSPERTELILTGTIDARQPRTGHTALRAIRHPMP